MLVIISNVGVGWQRDLFGCWSYHWPQFSQVYQKNGTIVPSQFTAHLLNFSDLQRIFVCLVIIAVHWPFPGTFTQEAGFTVSLFPSAGESTVTTATNYNSKLTLATQLQWCFQINIGFMYTLEYRRRRILFRIKYICCIRWEIRNYKTIKCMTPS